MEETAINWLSD